MNSQRCANCDSENRTEARFCRRCGVWLLANCPFCNAKLPEAALFCDQCGRQLSSAGGSAPHTREVLPPASANISHPNQERSTQSTFAQIESRSLVLPSALAKSELHQYIPEELMK